MRSHQFAQWLVNFRIFYGTRTFITVNRRDRHWSLSWIRWRLYLRRQSPRYPRRRRIRGLQVWPGRRGAEQYLLPLPGTLAVQPVDCHYTHWATRSLFQVRIKVNLSLNLIKHNVMKNYWVGVKACIFNLYLRYNWVISFMLRLLCSLGNKLL